MSKERTITISKAQVFFDMDMLSYGFSEVSGGPDAKRADRLALDTASDNGARIARRLCDHRISDIRHLLRRLVKSVTSSSASDSFLTGDWTITLYVSDETEDSTLAAVADLIHEYVANGALADYYAQMGAGVNVDSLNNRCNGDLARIRELLYYRPLPSMPS